MTYIINKNPPPRPHWSERLAVLAFVAAASWFVGVWMAAVAAVWL